jgi:hypothetical protein
MIANAIKYVLVSALFFALAMLIFVTSALIIGIPYTPHNMQVLLTTSLFLSQVATPMAIWS